MNEAIDREVDPLVSTPLAGVAVYTMFRGEPTQLLQWCNFHLNAGAARLYVVLDRPDSGLVSSLPVDARIDWMVLDQRTWGSLYPAGSQNVERKQVDGFRWMARRAATDGHDYLAFIDADELLALSEPFAHIAGRYPEAPALTVPVREMWYAEDDATTNPFGATHWPVARTRRAGRWIVCASSTPHCASPICAICCRCIGRRIWPC